MNNNRYFLLDNFEIKVYDDSGEVVGPEYESGDSVRFYYTDSTAPEPSEAVPSRVATLIRYAHKARRMASRLSHLVSVVVTKSKTAALVSPNGKYTPINQESFFLLSEINNAIKCGKEITVSSGSHLMTTQDAADFLEMSRSTVVRLMEAGEIPFERSARGAHRRVRIEDVLKYRESMHTPVVDTSVKDSTVDVDQEDDTDDAEISSETQQ